MNTRIVLATRLHPDRSADYIAMHRDPDPAVLPALLAHGHTNYRIHLVDQLLIASFDYTGTNLEQERLSMRSRPELRDWIERTAACQLPLSTGSTLWSSSQCIFSDRSGL
jgi:L-rhamnose mutarotase